MFERQIRLSRFDSEKVSNTLAPRTNNQHRENLSPNRSRSISPNDMALRQKRSAPVATLSLPAPTSYPDLVISHTPPTSSHIEINHEQSVIENKKKDDDNINQNLLLPADNDTDYQPLDFKSRLALFNGTNTIERSNEHSNKKPSVHPPPPPNFLTKPIVHHHVEKKDIPSDQSTRSDVNATKSITFFGGTQVNGNTKSTLPSSITPPTPLINKNEQFVMSTPIDSFRSPDFIGGNVKLNKSSIFSGTKKVRTNLY
jgi:hypothetical protein